MDVRAAELGRTMISTARVGQHRHPTDVRILYTNFVYPAFMFHMDQECLTICISTVDRLVLDAGWRDRVGCFSQQCQGCFRPRRVSLNNLIMGSEDWTFIQH